MPNILYRTAVRPALIYDAVTWAHEHKLEDAEM